MRKAILVLGMHRSGTSALTRVLSLLGAALPKNILGVGRGNEAGHWEPERLVTLHDRMLAEAGSRWDDWRAFDSATLGPERLAHYKAEIAHLIVEEYDDTQLLVLKDPRICRFAPLYADILASININARHILTTRNPLAVITSLAKRDGFTPGHSALLWLRHALDAEHTTRGAPRIFLSYENLMHDWRTEIGKIARAGEIDWPRSVDEAATDIDTLLSPELQHHVADDAQLLADERIMQWVKDAYTALTALEQRPDNDAALAALDRIKAKFDAVAPIFGDPFYDELAARERSVADARKLAEEQAAAINLARLEITELHSMYQNSISWKLTTPLRSIKRSIVHAYKLYHGIQNAVEDVGGRKKAIKKICARLKAQGLIETISTVLRHAEMRSHPESGKRMIAQRYRAIQEDARRRFDSTTESAPPSIQIENDQGDEVISILLPVYKVQIEYLRQAIESVLRQSYKKWELCIVDDCSQERAIHELIQKYALEDERIKATFSDTNLGISGASNLALSMATGRFFCLLDHDDMLTCDALATLAEEIKHDLTIDAIYSDECKIDESGTVGDLFLKPDWDPYLLHNCMYIGHLTTYRTEKVRAIGGFRSQYDLSQDYDLALRISETTHRIKHIPRILYGWRTIPQSAASGGKPQARITNIAALQDAMNRQGLTGTAIALPATNRILLDRGQFNITASIIIPSDNVEHIEAAITSIREKTSYKKYEIIVVTNSKDASFLQKRVSQLGPIKYVKFDAPFNFSEKCNLGASASTDDLLIFFNDDVRVKSEDWIEAILDYASIPNVGAIGPKLLYEDDTIQHAGMVSGVRGLFGTAFHTFPANSSEYFNFAQSVRHVSVICGACLAIRRSVFESVGGFDAEKFPIAHSDVDLCFRIRAAGYSCIYTPHAELYHIGHASIGQIKKTEARIAQKKDKADIEALKRWPEYTSYDPYFPPQMAEIIYRDSQEFFRIFPGQPSNRPETERSALLISHDLSESGAPRVVLELAKALLEAKYFVIIASPTDGSLRHEMTSEGITVIIDELILSQHETALRFAKNFDAVIVNTIVGWPAVLQMGKFVPIFWYIHETKLAADIFSTNRNARDALKQASDVWVGSNVSGDVVGVFFDDYVVLPYGTKPTLPQCKKMQIRSKAPINISVFGSYEPRKGQDLAILAMEELDGNLRKVCKLNLFGRVLDKTFHGEVVRTAAKKGYINIGAELPYSEYERALIDADIVLIPSRDDTLPLVSIDALKFKKILVCSRATGTAAFIQDGISGFISSESTPTEIAKSLAQAFSKIDQWDSIGEEARNAFEKNFSSEAFAKRVLDRLALKTQQGE